MLATSISATTNGDVALSLTVENEGTEPVELPFRTAQRADFVAYRDGEEVWRWSDGRMFAQVLGEERLNPGETLTVDATWDAPPSGEYRVVGELVARGVDVASETTVTVP